MKFDWKLTLATNLMKRYFKRNPRELTLAELRALDARDAEPLFQWIFGPPAPMAKIETRTIPVRDSMISLRFYYPRIASNLPILMFFHGGGFVRNTLRTYDSLCTRLAAGSGALVVSVAYRRAPEHMYPIPVEDCYDATCWVVDNAYTFGGDPSRLVVVGDSAGGNLASAVCLMSRDLNGPKINYQVMLYPVTDSDGDSLSRSTFSEGPLLTQDDIDFYGDSYVGVERPADMRYFDLLHVDDLEGLPPALILTAQYDPLRDEGKRYAQHLRAAGVPVRYSEYLYTIHGFMSMPTLAAMAYDAETEVCTVLREVFTQPAQQVRGQSAAD